jgi:hypothetical protein
MKKAGLLIILAGGAVIAVASLATQVGGIEVRTARLEQDLLPMAVAEPIVLGVLTTVSWDRQQRGLFGQVKLNLRTAKEVVELGQASVSTGEMKVKFPCGVAEEARLVLLGYSGEVIGQRGVRVLPPGPDCLF